ncbi:uncharacterized protein BT62DRAFT_1003995 [Guyanagaster necrorhizus]|uniref:Uncharacterized protein n=1 Tax=Guyanagaster necrorhizus TaxID=856835 RepID=A0A9P7VX58_9AGAR|nr:uncharacterized protein BT62DRAFT_1003995 [Guyanagaster necrorhizus MCA 3950]KAG7448197.1 hypothetical protein BT62DRAFT_1003995 [Guyanagaster necrorhizus MCA 3950]
MLQIHVLQGWELIEDLEKLPQRLKAASYEFQRGDAVAVWKKGTVGLETSAPDSNRALTPVNAPKSARPADEAAGQKGRLVIEFRTEVNDLLKDFERKRGSSLPISAIAESKRARAISTFNSNFVNRGSVSQDLGQEDLPQSNPFQLNNFPTPTSITRNLTGKQLCSPW